MVQAYLLLQREMGRITRAQSLISKPIHTPTPHHSCLTFGSLRAFFEQRLQLYLRSATPWSAGIGISIR